MMKIVKIMMTETVEIVMTVKIVNGEDCEDSNGGECRW